jgi:hypothetical protein
MTGKNGILLGRSKEPAVGVAPAGDQELTEDPADRIGRSAGDGPTSAHIAMIELYRIDATLPAPGHSRVARPASDAPGLPARLRTAQPPDAVLTVFRGQAYLTIAGGQSGRAPVGLEIVTSAQGRYRLSEPAGEQPVEVVLHVKAGAACAGDLLDALLESEAPPSLDGAERLLHSQIVHGRIRFAPAGDDPAELAVFGPLPGAGAHAIDDVLARPPASMANILAPDISSQPLAVFDAGIEGYAEQARTHYLVHGRHALQGAKDGGRAPEESKRMANLQLSGDGGSTPTFLFLLDATLLQAIERATHRKGAELSQNELLRLALANAGDAVAADFDEGAINAINASYYASPIAFDPAADLADLYATNRPLNRIFGRLATEHAAGADRVRMKVLCAGGRNAHWADVAHGVRENGGRGLDVVMTDFAVPSVPATTDAAFLRLRTERHSLFDPLPELAPAERFHALLCTYGFDSVWQPEDLRLRHAGGRWYVTRYRVKVADWHPRKEALLQALRERRPLADAAASDYEGIFVEHAYEEIDLAAHPYAALLQDHADAGKIDTIDLPGGLIKTVLQAFDRQLRAGGVFMIGDTVSTDWADDLYGSRVSGTGARFKTEDYVLAARILQQAHGLQAELVELDDAARRYLPPNWVDESTELERQQLLSRSSNVLMIVRR